MKLAWIPFVIAGFFSVSAFAEEPCASELNQSIQSRVKDAENGATLSLHDVFSPALEFARDHPQLLAQDQFGEIDGGELFASFRKRIDRLEKAKCIDDLTARYYSALSQHVRFASAQEVLIDEKVVEEWPSLRVYWANRAHVARIRAKLAEENPEVVPAFEQADAELAKAFTRKVKGIGKMPLHEHLLLTFNVGDLNLISDEFLYLFEIMKGIKGKAVIETVEGKIIEIPFASGDIRNLGLNAFDTRMEALRNTSLKKRPVGRSDALVAAYLTGLVDPAILAALLRNEDFQEEKNTFWKKFGNTAWTIGSTVLYQIPITSYAVTLTNLIRGAIERKKEEEEAASNASHLIRR